MNKDAFERLSLINNQLMLLCSWLNEKRDIATASRLSPLTDHLTHLIAELSVKRE